MFLSLAALLVLVLVLRVYVLVLRVYVHVRTSDCCASPVPSLARSLLLCLRL